MSFGFSISDAFALGQLAWNTVQNSRKACGEHDELTREVSALHVVLLRLQQEVEKPESPINKSGDTCREELQVIAKDCGKVLRLLDKILDKYNALSERERSGRKLWQKVKFGNGETGDIGKLRSKIVLYTSTMTFYLNMVSMGAVGRIEQKMNSAGGILKDLQLAVNSITAHFVAKSTYEESVFTTYADDEKAVWREFRRELVHDGFSSSVIRNHKRTIMKYVKELGSRGLLDDQDPLETPTHAGVATIATAKLPKVETELLPEQPDSPLSHQEDSMTSSRRLGDGVERKTVSENASKHSRSGNGTLDTAPSAIQFGSTASHTSHMRNDWTVPTEGAHEAYAETVADSDSDEKETLDDILLRVENASSDEDSRQASPADSPDVDTARNASITAPNDTEPTMDDSHNTECESECLDSTFLEDVLPPHTPIEQHHYSKILQALNQYLDQEEDLSLIPNLGRVFFGDCAGKVVCAKVPETINIFKNYVFLREAYCKCIAEARAPDLSTETECILNKEAYRLREELQSDVLTRLYGLETPDDSHFEILQDRLMMKTKVLLDQVDHYADGVSLFGAHQMWHLYHHNLAPRAIHYAILQMNGQDVDESLQRVVSHIHNISGRLTEPRIGLGKIADALVSNLLQDVNCMLEVFTGEFDPESWMLCDTRDPDSTDSTCLSFHSDGKRILIQSGPKCPLCEPDDYGIKAPGLFQSPFWRHEIRDISPRNRAHSVRAVKDV